MVVQEVIMQHIRLFLLMSFVVSSALFSADELEFDRTMVVRPRNGRPGRLNEENLKGIDSRSSMSAVRADFYDNGSGQIPVDLRVPAPRAISEGKEPEENDLPLGLQAPSLLSLAARGFGFMVKRATDLLPSSFRSMQSQQGGGRDERADVPAHNYADHVALAGMIASEKKLNKQLFFEIYQKENPNGTIENFKKLRSSGYKILNQEMPGLSIDRQNDILCQCLLNQKWDVSRFEQVVCFVSLQQQEEQLVENQLRLQPVVAPEELLVERKWPAAPIAPVIRPVMEVLVEVSRPSLMEKEQEKKKVINELAIEISAVDFQILKGCSNKKAVSDLSFSLGYRADEFGQFYSEGTSILMSSRQARGEDFGWIPVVLGKALSIASKYNRKEYVLDDLNEAVLALDQQTKYSRGGGWGF